MLLCATCSSINAVTGNMAAIYVLLSVSLKLNFLDEADCPSTKNIFCTFAKGLLNYFISEMK